MEKNVCMSCGTEQGLIGKQDFYCERCGAKNTTDGWCQDVQSENQRNENCGFYDSRNEYRDREDYLRNR